MRNRFHFIRQGKRHAQTIAALLLAGVMSMAPAGMAFAESEADDGPQTEAEAADTTYAGYLGAAVDAAANPFAAVTPPSIFFTVILFPILLLFFSESVYILPYTAGFFPDSV